MTQRTAVWYDKPSPTFVDAIALVRRHLWLASEGFSPSAANSRLPTNWSFHAATGPPYSVGVSPEGVIGNAQSIQRDRPTAGRHQ